MNAEKTKKLHLRMTEGRIPPLILRQALPSTVGMLVTALYSLADAFFVSELGTSASAAVGVTFSIQALIQAIGYTLGLGAGSLISRKLGEKRDGDAGRYARIAFWLSILSGILIMLAGLFWGGPILRTLGAGESIYPYAMSYARFLFFSTPFMCTAFVLSQLLRAEGKAIYSMVGLLSGSLLNIALDPLLIHTVGLGIAGASLATLISQAVSVLILLSAYVFHKSQIELFQKISLSEFSETGRVLLTGLPSAFRQGLTVFATVLLNRAAGAWGDAAVAAISAVTRLFLFAFSVCLGVGQGMMPVVGYNYGFGKPDRVRHAFLFSVGLSTAAMLVISIPFWIYAPDLISLLRDDAEVIRIGEFALRLQCYVFFCHGLITCTIMFLQAIGNRFGSTFLASARQGLFFAPLIFLLPSFFGAKSILYVQPIADASTFLLAIFFAIYAGRALHSVKQTKSDAAV